MKNASNTANEPRPSDPKSRGLMAASGLKVETPAPRSAWQDLMVKDIEAVPYQSPKWTDSVCASGVFADVSRLYTMPDGRRFLLPLARRTGRPDWLSAAHSLPAAWGMGGVIGDTAASVEDLTLIANDIASLPYLQIRIRPNPRLGNLWDAAVPLSVTRVDRIAHVLDLAGGFDHLWSTSFSGKTRNAVRKAERTGVVVEKDTTGRLMPIFHKLLEQSFDRWALKQNEPRFLTRLRGSARDPLDKFLRIAHQMGDACVVWVAWVGGVPAASIIVLQYKNANDSRGAMDRDAVGSSGAGDLLQRLAIEDAVRAGCRYYHMGETGNSRSLAHFKAGFGAIPVKYNEYSFERLPITKLDRAARRAVKQVIGFKDA